MRCWTEGFKSTEDRRSDALHARFVTLHRPPGPFLLANAGDAASARLYQEDADAVAELVALGAVGINLEDAGADPQRLVTKIEAARRRLGPTPVFINARTDVYLLGMATGGDAVRETVSRLARYAAARADGGLRARPERAG